MRVYISKMCIVYLRKMMAKLDMERKQAESEGIKEFFFPLGIRTLLGIINEGVSGDHQSSVRGVEVSCCI